MDESEENLREALLDLARAQQRERSARQESEAVLAGLRGISAAQTTAAIYAQLFEALRPVIGFQDALVLAPDGDPMRVISATIDGDFDDWDLGRLLERSTQRGALAVFDARQVPDLCGPGADHISLLIAPLDLTVGTGALVMTHRQVGFFGGPQAAILQRLIPLLTQAVFASESRELEAQRRIASIARFPDENPQPVLRVASDGQILYQNQAARALLGEDLLPEIRERLVAALQAYRPVSSQPMALNERMFQAAIAPFPDSGYVNLYLTDVTARHQVEDQLRRASRRMAALIGNQQAAVLLEDEHRDIVLTNQSFCDLFGIPAPPSTLLGTSCVDAAAQSSHLFAVPDAFEARVDELLAAQRTCVGEEMEMADGRIVERDYVPIELDGSAAGHLWQYRDVTERHRQQRQLQEALRTAEQANRAKSDFLARMSHDIRTPLNAIIGMSELTLDTPLSEEQRAYLRSVHTNSQALLYLINDVLDLSRIESGQLVFSRVPFYIRDLVEDLCEGFSVQAANRGIAIIGQIHRRVPARVLGDPNRLRQILANLIGNAVKYTDTGAVRLDVQLLARTSL
ncbi:MAG: histidine kinase dimerization/phospho-acceptor domain-containing protein, partial [Myxococcota bacterium]